MESNKLLQTAVPLLLEWYRIYKRDLPWRQNKDPYRIWISEIMLQQTRVEAVKEYYRRFLEQFPTVFALANADEEEVLKAWEGLGYYSRARNLHKSAKQIANKGAFPRTWEEVRALPGIGDYTAGAICSIAYDMPYPAVDGNVMRVLTRLLADGRNVDEPSTRKALTQALKEVYPSDAGDFCQALMELGAIVCVPNGAPLCENCPWGEICLARKGENAEAFPVKKEKKERKKIDLSVFVMRCGQKYAIEKRAEKGLLSGLWQFPIGEGIPSGKILAKKRAKHIFTHVEWNMTGYLVEVEREDGAFRWVTAEELKEKYALPSAFRAFLPWVISP
ncbi:MAG: A/G-specific adenine glycosylase [Clostridia bacterium]|nr:A/G-specific adenine glycosylase [Clostridia bacterium]